MTAAQLTVAPTTAASSRRQCQSPPRRDLRARASRGGRRTRMTSRSGPAASLSMSSTATRVERGAAGWQPGALAKARHHLAGEQQRVRQHKWRRHSVAARREAELLAGLARHRVADPARVLHDPLSRACGALGRRHRVPRREVAAAELARLRLQLFCRAVNVAPRRRREVRPRVVAALRLRHRVLQRQRPPHSNEKSRDRRTRRSATAARGVVPRRCRQSRRFDRTAWTCGTAVASERRRLASGVVVALLLAALLSAATNKACSCGCGGQRSSSAIISPCCSTARRATSLMLCGTIGRRHTGHVGHELSVPLTERFNQYAWPPAEFGIG